MSLVGDAKLVGVLEIASDSLARDALARDPQDQF